MTLRPALLAATALAAALGNCLALCRWGAGGDRDLAGLARAVRSGDELEATIEVGRHRDEAKRALAAEVIAGTMSLREAADHFRRLDEANSGFFAHVLPPPRDERFYCDRVLDTVWGVLGHPQRYAAAARWYAEAFTAHPHLLAGPPAGQRYYAARAAALAGCGQGRDAADLDEESRAHFRRQALDWLRDELEAQRRLLGTEPEKIGWILANGLQRWLWDSDFAGVRGPDALARLPAAERQAWQRLWADVANTLGRAQRTTVREQEAGSQVQRPER
jgi:hypothetical protein